ncbi:MAG TPA: hypothetical protein VHB02_06040 [Acidimicrobiales bacterium]|nr:hypothetical protein [Acidimicrobiales bacterium]
MTPQTVDKFGTRTPGTPVKVPGCVIYETPGIETLGGQDTVVQDAQVLAPPDTVVTSTDRVTVNGKTYEVVATPIIWRSPLTGNEPCVQIQLRRVKG